MKNSTTHGSHCLETDGTLLCGWPDEHPLASVRNVMQVRTARDNVVTLFHWSDADGIGAFVSRNPEA